MTVILSTVWLNTSTMAQDRVEESYPSRTDTLLVSGPGPFLVRPLMIPHSETVLIDGRRLSQEEYDLDFRWGHIVLHSALPERELNLVVVYDYIPLSVPDSYRLWRIADFRRAEKTGSSPGALRADRVRTSYASVPKLNRSGSITRGITAGSTRDVAVESGLRLQVDGEIVEGLQLRAVLTDENTPILPEGTTQRLNEFDRVFIELKSSMGTVQMGDFDAVIRGGEFARLNRKLQGVTAFGTVGAGSGPLYSGGSFVISGATSRGVFRVQEIIPSDGIQGPYRLEGESGERFIITLPGSEVVFVDGQRKQRGETRDYTIDYTTGEITFTPSMIVSADRRISVEFQYTTNQFTRTLLAADAVSHFGKMADGQPLVTFGATIIREADGDQFSQEFGFSREDSLAIVEAGDNDAQISGAVRIEYNPEALFTQYVREDKTDGSGSVIHIFRAVTQKPAEFEPVYRVTFTRVGPGSGSYRRTGQIINGIVYEYVGSNLAEYEPIRTLPKPVVRQLVDFRTVLRPFAAFEISGEWGASVFDQNRLSAFDSADDIGSAYFIRASLRPVVLEVNSTSIGRLSAEFSRRRRDENFTTFERIRPIEFARKWNIREKPINATGGINDAGNETVDDLSIALAWADSSDSRLGISRIRLQDGFKGSRIEAALNLIEEGLPQLSYRLEYISSTDRILGQNGTWIRQFGRVSHAVRGGALIPFLELEYEDLIQKDVVSTETIRPSVRFLESRAGMDWNRDRMTLGAQIERRVEDRIVSAGEREPFDSWTITGNAVFNPGSQFHSVLALGYRTTSGSEFATTPTTAESTSDRSSLILRWNGRWRPSGARSNLSWLYQAQTERTATLQEVYIRTGQERGEYVWVDDNEDGVIQLDEFIPETTPDEGLYVRTFLPSDSLESITSVKGRIRFEYSGRRASDGDQNVFRRLFGGIGTSTVLDFEEKSRDPERRNLYLLRFDRFRSPEHTLNGRIRVRQEVSLFRNIPGVDLTLTGQEARSLTTLVAGEESQLSRFGRFLGRLRLGTAWHVRIRVEQSRESLTSESFATRNHDILSTLLSPSLTWNASRALQLSITSILNRKKDRRSDISATVIQFPITARYRIERRMDLAGRFEVADVTLSSQVRGLTAYEMTEGRGPGTSFLWGVTVQSNLTEVLTATLSYDGRAPSGAPVIHTARFQLSARF